MGLIRPCADDDRAAILALVNAAAEAYRGVIPADRWHEPYMPRDELDGEIAAGRPLLGLRGRTASSSASWACSRFATSSSSATPTSRRAGSAAASAARCSNTSLERTTTRILVGTWAAAEWAVRFYERHGFAPVGRERTAELLRAYWTIPERQIETSVVLARPPY